MMKKITFILVLFLVVLSSGIGIVSAETLTGTLEGSGMYQIHSPSNITYVQNAFPTLIKFNQVELTGNIKSYVFWNMNDGNTTTKKLIFGGGTPPMVGNSAPFNFTYAGVERANGTVGFQRGFDGSGVETSGYVWMSFNYFNNSGLSGDIQMTFNSNSTLLYGVYTDQGNSDPYGMLPPGGFAPTGYTNGVGIWAGDMYWLKEDILTHNYEATYPQGIGINGTVLKMGTNSITYVTNQYGSTITSDGISNNLDFTFSVLPQPIIIAAQSPAGIWFNSSILFSSVIPFDATPTPTPTPGTGEPAPGYVRTIVHVRDRSGAMIHGSNIYIKDVDGNVWSNSTSDADAIHSIDTHPDHVVNFYAEFTIFANEFLPGSLLTQYAGSTYYLTLDPFESRASAGNVSLYVEVKDTSGSFIPYANVQIFLPDGYSYAGSTANLGSKVFIVPNETQIRATGTASGYLPGTVIGNSGTLGSTTMLITLSRQFVTTAPTTTIPPGGITPAVTMDPNDPVLHGGDTSFQGQEMMRYLANNGMTLVQLCFMVTILALLGFKFGK